MLVSSSQFGICWDELQMSDYGIKVLKFYTSFGKDSSYNTADGVMHFYGPFFDLLGAVVNHGYKGDTYERRHFFIAFFGFLGILFAGLTARDLANWKVALLSELFVFLTPVYFGHSMFNSKDIPFAGAYIAAIYFMLRFARQFPKVSWQTITGVIVFTGMAIAIRIGGLLLFMYFVFFLGVKLFRMGKEPVMDLLKNRKAIFQLFFALIGAYCFALIFWPYALTSPVKHPLESLTAFSKYALDSGSLFNGGRPHYWELPWNYLPTWIYVTTPLFICGGVLLSPIILYKWKAFNEVVQGDFFLVLLFTSVFPVFYIVYKESNVYDGWRHVLFIYPSLAVCCALIWYGVFSVLRKTRAYLNYIAVPLLALFMLEPAIYMAKYPKMETFYFSPVIGGVKGAWKKFDIDYYGTSLRYAVEWIGANADSLEKGPGGKIRIRCFYGERISVEHAIEKDPRLVYVFANESSLDWDYSIIQPVQAKHDTALLTNWPPKGLIHQIEVDGTPIVAIARNYNKDTKKEVDKFSINDNKDANALVGMSVKYYQVGDFFNCIAACEKALLISPANVAALNNAASAFNNLYMFDEALDYANRCLKLNPNFDMAKGNIVGATERKKQSANINKEGVSNNYLNASLIYFNLKEYEKFIEFNEKALSYFPNNPVAYTNIGAGYNSSGNYEKAIVVLTRALKLNPNFQKAQENLNFARQHSEQGH